MNLSLCYCYFNQPQMLARQVKEWKAYPLAAKEKLEIVITDDGSTKERTAEKVLKGQRLGIPLRLFYVENSKPWNQMGARNLSMSKAKGPWIYGLDIDHLIPADQIEALLSKELERKKFYKVRRQFPKGTKRLISPCNVWILHHEDFCAAVGYDEDYAGNKGWSDVLFVDVMNLLGYRVEHIWDVTTHAYSNRDSAGVQKDAIPDAAVLGLDRNIKKNMALHERKRQWLKKHGVRRYLKDLKAKGVCRFKWREIS